MRWTKAAWALKARMAIHRVKRDAAAGAVALDAVSKAMASNADDMQFSFGAAETEGNPWYQFNTQRGDIAVGPKLPVIRMINSMVGLSSVFVIPSLI
jgi:hypothetical protein